MKRDTAYLPLGFVLVSCMFAMTAQAAEKEKLFPDIPTDSVSADTIAKIGLSESATATLRKNKFIIAGPAFNQVFEAYAPSPLDKRQDFPRFVTSDAVLNGFHVLYEESIARLEQSNARLLRAAMADGWTRLLKDDGMFQGKPAVITEARRRARAVIGAALLLAGGKPTGGDAATLRLIDADVMKVTTARGMSLPAWLGAGAPDFLRIDYSRMKPRGFYDRSDRLRQYFRATAWLQAAAFRLDNDEDLLAAMMIRTAFTRGAGVLPDNNAEEHLTKLGKLFDDLVGPPADRRVLDLPAIHNQKFDLDQEGISELRKRIQPGGLPLGFAPLEEKPLPVLLRVLPARRVPDSAMFNATTDREHFPNRPYPTGLELCVALGGTRHAGKLQKGEQWEAVVELIRDAHNDLVADDNELGGASLYRRYLHCLAALHAEPEKDVPPFMKGDPWKTKQCQTTLAGWAQLRHTWVLQAKESISVFAGAPREPGFVEPVPEFYGRLGALVLKTQEVLTRGGALGADLDSIADDLRKAIAEVEKADVAGTGLAGWNAMKDGLQSVVSEYSSYRNWHGNDPDNLDWVRIVAGCLVEWKMELKRLETGEQPTKAVADTFGVEGTDLMEAWKELQEICRTSELLSHKQLREAPFNRRDNEFFETFGTRLAHIMLYGHQAFISPNDDAPRIADVHTYTDTRNVLGLLEVGIGRPQAIYVLYPWQGKEVLCRGAVLPYYEFTSTQRLTDEQWRKKLDAPDRPWLPEWVRPLYADGDAAKLEKKAQ
jgi:hypothetical protein